MYNVVYLLAAADGTGHRNVLGDSTAGAAVSVLFNCGCSSAQFLCLRNVNTASGFHYYIHQS